METLLIYGIKSAGIITIFYLFYIVLLQKETFLNVNRYFLLFGILVSTILPITTFVKTVWVEPSIQTINETNALVENNIKNLNPVIIIEQSAAEIDWFLIALIVYGIGILVLLIQFIVDLYTIKRFLKLNQSEKHKNYTLVSTTKNVTPFSFFNWIVVNQSLHQNSELQNILAHEKIHCQQFHSIDVLIAKVFTIVFWFNPIVWLYKKAIVQNLEFIADFEAVKIVTDKKNYQLTLLKITTQQNCVALSNHFYQSLIKKRIVMLNKNQSKKWQFWKYAILIPILIAFVFQFQMKVVAQEKEILSENLEISTVRITKNATNAEIKEDCERVKKATNIDLEFYDIKRNSKGEIQNISASFNDNNGSKSSYNQKKSSAIDDFYFIYKKSLSNGKIEIGFKEAESIKVGDLPPTSPLPPMPPMSAMPPIPPIPAMPLTKNNTTIKKIILIDASHGGNDSGANNNGFSEKEITLSIAKKIKLLAENSDIEIVLTRSDDSSISLQERKDKIEQIKPNFMISLHVNANPDVSKSGIEAFVYEKSPFYNDSFDQANGLLRNITNGNPAKLTINNAKFAVLRNTTCPSVLLELGYITNDRERNFLTSETGQNEIAKNIFRFLQK